MESITLTHVSEHVIPYYSKLLPQLTDFYCKNADKEDWEIFRDMALVFRKELTKDVCTPLELDDGACTAIALVLAKEEAKKIKKKETKLATPSTEETLVSTKA